MGKHPSLFILIVSVLLSSIFLLLMSGIVPISQDAFSEFRLQQITAIDLQSKKNIQHEMYLGTVNVSDYFVQTENGFQYQGGVYDGWWEVGKTYDAQQLNSGEYPNSGSQSFLNFPFRNKNFYINIDRGDESAVKEFLTVMDPHGQYGIDTLILDFRFLQTIDFGSVIRLFNQLAPQHRITFGKIIDAHQEEEIESSGKPFFSVGHTIFLADLYMPDAVSFMLQRFSQLPSYELLGNFELVSDTICLETEYTVGKKIYRVCTDKMTMTGYDEGLFKPISTVDDILMVEMLDKVDDLWYKKRDTSSVKNYLMTSFSTLSP